MYYFIVNTASGSGKGADVWKRISSVLKERKVQYKAYKTRYKGHARELATKISSLDVKELRLIVVGGDGTINEVINGITDFEKVVFFVIPTGSGNDFARGMGISKNVEITTNAIIDCDKTDRIDLGVAKWCNSIESEIIEQERLFTVSSGMGMDAEVCRRALDGKLKKTLNQYGIGALTYFIHTLQALFSLENNTAQITFTHTRETDKYNEVRVKWDRFVFSGIMNFSCEGGGIPMAPRADAKDGLLSVCTGHGVKKWQTFLVLPFIVLGKHNVFSYFDIRNVSKICIENDKPIQLHTDGEYCGMVNKVEYSVKKGMLRVLSLN
ncbi:MAG: YegS/Rv2252/BmrU family lipid kinase [Lachnospiraceae bacterium]|nr:YegS/Rv2252/BmrU family lipid kinase [Lachnospiraceae bacterium]